jgi:O-antigen/teichoic acid export membrane protein
MVINGLYFIPANNIVYIKKAVKFLPIATIVAGISTIFFNFLLIPYFGVYGSAWAGIISNLICLSITFYISEKFYSIKYEYKRITMIFLITGILIIFLFFIQSLSINWWKLVLLKLVGISVYFVFFYYSGFLRVSELSNLKDILSKFIPFRKTTSSQ